MVSLLEPERIKKRDTKRFKDNILRLLSIRNFIGYFSIYQLMSFRSKFFFKLSWVYGNLIYEAQMSSSWVQPFTSKLMLTGFLHYSRILLTFLLEAVIPVRLEVHFRWLQHSFLDYYLFSKIFEKIELKNAFSFILPHCRPFNLLQFWRIGDLEKEFGAQRRRDWWVLFLKNTEQSHIKTNEYWYTIQWTQIGSEGIIKIKTKHVSASPSTRLSCYPFVEKEDVMKASLPVLFN